MFKKSLFFTQRNIWIFPGCLFLELYQGKWKPRKIPNPDYFEDSDPFSTMTSIGALGLELWSMSDGIYFDNFIITDDKAVSDQWAAESWELKSAQETSGGLSGVSWTLQVRVNGVHTRR